MSARRYFKFNELNQYLDNEADINYFAVNQARRVAVGNMLGDYDEYGYYVIDDEIIKELVAMPKLIVDSVEGIDLLRGAIKFDNFIHFMLAIEDDKAKLVLLEKINFESNIKYNVGRYSDMNEYVLQEISIPDRDIDKNVIYSKFNIKREDEGMFYDFKDLNETEMNFYKGLVKKMKYNAVAQTSMFKNEKAIEIIEADYFDNILNSFEKYPKYKEEFVRFLKAVIIEKQEFVQINKPFFQKTINEILDSAVSLFLSKLPADIRAEIEEEIRKVKEKYFYEFNKIMHLQYISNQNAKANEDSFISNIMAEKRDKNSRTITLDVDKSKLEQSYLAILEEKDSLKSQAESKNADKKTITDDNPTLSKFFGDIKKETGNDLLKSKDNENAKGDKVEIDKKPEKVDETKNVKKETARNSIISRRSSSNEKTQEVKAPRKVEQVGRIEPAKKQPSVVSVKAETKPQQAQSQQDNTKNVKSNNVNNNKNLATNNNRNNNQNRRRHSSSSVQGKVATSENDSEYGANFLL